MNVTPNRSSPLTTATKATSQHIYRYQWKNPAPQKKIVGIKLEGSGETDVRVLLYGIEGLYNDR